MTDQSPAVEALIELWAKHRDGQLSSDCSGIECHTCTVLGQAADALAAQAQQLAQAEQDRDKWLDAFNRSEQFQSGPTKRAEQAEQELKARERIIETYEAQLARTEQTVAQLTRERDDLWLAYQAERDKVRP